ncbi:MFS transporter [Pseudalkalibacillus hwajinpoensis]|uniref:MFS transporter n=1 Tax=Guptibacillus hwajinpoensis TaxID=208199 RepID=A0A4U1MDR8_9BACL|nr:MFS transporter [Pseudalkalibacillus hwajinpoensis]TKD68280.1 MFS transporter [Pseudalkalibacillus hwajinpoensis]
MSTKRPIWTKSFINIFVSNLFVFIVFYALLTLLPIYVTDAIGGSESQAGLIITIFLLSAIIVRPFSGRLIDRFGKKKMLVTSAGFFAITSFIYPLVDHYFALLLLRFFHGVWFSIVTTAAGAIAADSIPRERRGEGLGYFAMSMNLAVVTGPFIALTLLQFVSYVTIFLILSAIMIVGVLCTLGIKTIENSAPVKTSKLAFEDLFEKKSFPIAIVGLFVAFSYASVISFISLYAKSLGLLDAAGFFFAVFAVAMLVSRPFTGRLFDTRGPNTVILPAFVLFAIGLMTLSFTNVAWMLLLAGAFIGLGYGSIVPSFQTLAIQAAPESRSAHATATFFTFFDTGIATGSYVLGIIVTTMGYANLYMSLSIFVIGILFFYQWVRKQNRTRKQLQSQTNY